MATSTLFPKEEAMKILDTSPWQEFNDADIGHSPEESIAITVFSSTYNLRLGIKTIRRTSAVTEVWLHPVGYDVGRLQQEDLDLIVNAPMPLAQSKKGPDMCQWLRDLDCTACVTVLKQAEPDYLALIANHCDMESPGIVETMVKETDISLPIDCFQQVAKTTVDVNGDIKWVLSDNAMDWAAKIIKSGPNNESRDALIRNLTQILDDSIPVPILTSSREVDDSNGAIVARVDNPPRDVDTSDGAIVATVRNNNYSKDMFDSETSSSKHNTGDIILHTDETTGEEENILASTPARRVFYEEDSDAASPIISQKKIDDS